MLISNANSEMFTSDRRVELRRRLYSKLIQRPLAPAIMADWRTVDNLREPVKQRFGFRTQLD